MKNINEHIIINHVLFDISRNPLMLIQCDRPHNILVVNTGYAKDGYFHILSDEQNEGRITQLKESSDIPSSAKIPVAILEADYVSSFTIAKSINNNSLAHKLNFMVPDRYIFERLNGQLPDFYIGDDVFGFDGENDLLTPIDGLTDPIMLTAFKWISSTNPYDDWDADKKEVFYHIKSRQIVDVDLELLTTWPKDVISIVIPAPIFCDPIGVARNRGLEDFSQFYQANSTLITHAQLYDVHSFFHTQINNKLDKVTENKLIERVIRGKKLPF
jgi:hypothetical protein